MPDSAATRKVIRLLRILLQTRFHPSVGGIESLAEVLATQWLEVGCRVSIVTDVSSSGNVTRFPFPVHYAPSARSIRQLARKHDVVVQMNVSLRALWPVLLAGIPWVAVHQSCYARLVEQKLERDWCDHAKLFFARRAAANIAASAYIAQEIGVPSQVIPNAYDSATFRNGRSFRRDRELVFVGRLVSDKGCDTLLMALDLLGPRFLPRLTIVGDGPERAHLEQRARQLGLADRVEFTGSQFASSVAEILNEHKVVVVPSLWEEPFGIVALEGAACGCVVVGSDGGGLPEAIGPTGIVFRRGDPGHLAEKLGWLLESPERMEPFQAAAPAHLAAHQAGSIASRYLKVLKDVVKGQVDD